MIFLDRYIRENATARAIVSQLPRNDETVDALLTQLVASQARVFAGTLFSTFTALIHRLRGFASQESSFLYCYNDFLSPLVRFDRCEFLPVDDGPFSWNRIRYPVSPDAYSWLREWPKSSDSALPAFYSEPLPPDRLELLPSRASTNGSTLRCIEDDGGETVLGNWTDPADFVTWEILLPESGWYAVEMRYACPEESAGSRYRVGIQGADELHAAVWNTGAWASPSPWLSLGRLRIRAGRSTLVVRAVEKPADAVMNLRGLRLTRVE